MTLNKSFVQYLKLISAVSRFCGSQRVSFGTEFSLRIPPQFHKSIPDYGGLFQSDSNVGGNQAEMLADNWPVWNATWVAPKNCLDPDLVRK